MPARVRPQPVAATPAGFFLDLPSLVEVFPGRLLTDKEVIREVTGKPLAPPGFELALQELILAGEIEAQPGIALTPGGLPRCQRCGSFNIVTAPCTRCGYDRCYACQDCAELGVIRGCTPLFNTQKSKPVKVTPLPALPNLSALTSGQESLLKEMLEFVQGAEERCVVDAVCGAGKGYIILHFLRELLRLGFEGPILFTTPRRSVLEEWADEYGRVLGKENLSVLYGGRHEYNPEAAVTMATLPQLYRFLCAFKVVIIDEADAFPLGEHSHLWGVIRRAMQKGAKLLLFTATPQTLSSLTSSAVNLRLPVRFHGGELPLPEVVVAKSDKGLYQKAADLVGKWLAERNMRVFIFVPTKIIGRKVFSYITKNGYTGKFACFHAGVSDFDEQLRKFRDGEVRVAISTTVLERGITISPCAVLVFWADHASFGTASLVQMAGRAGRSKAHPTGEVVFLCRTVGSKCIKSAVDHIRGENLEAAKKGCFQSGDGDKVCPHLG